MSTPTTANNVQPHTAPPRQMQTQQSSSRARPHRRGGRRRVAWAIAAAIIALLAAGYGYYHWEVNRHEPEGAANQVFVIESGDSVTGVADNLKTTGLIRNRLAFVMYVLIHGERSKLQAGFYELSAAQSVADIADAISGGIVSVRRLVVPEGWRVSQIRDAVAKLGIDNADFDAAVEVARQQDYFKNVSTEAGIEGYLFPDSYQIAPSTSAGKLISNMMDNFNTKVNTVYARAFADQGLTIHQGLTLASMVEREVNNVDDRPIVAQIFLARLQQDMSLGSDVTAQYASDMRGVALDLNIDSPYNTRRYKGLPPGPICNPGLGAIEAVAHPASTKYLYFLTGKDGKTYFAKTYAEHQRNIQLHM